MRARQPKQSGYILAEVLVVVACLVALIATLAANQRAAMRETQDKLRQRRAEIGARSGVAYAVSVLQNATPNLTTQNDDWYTLGNSGKEAFTFGDATIRLQLVDAGAFININTATEAQLQQLPVTQEQIDSLLDWREAGQTPRANGAKDSYYNALEEPYNTKLGPLTTLDELLLIKGWTAQELYTLQTNTVTSQIQPQDIKGNRIPLVGIFTTDSSAPNTRADGSARTNFGVRLNPQAVAQQLRVNAQLALQIANRSPYNSFRALLGMPGITSNTAKTLLDSVRFGGGNTSTGKLNVNTASEEALRSLPNMPADVAASIVSRQSSGIQSLGELSSVPGLTGNTLAQLADSFTVGSNTWIVRVYSVSGGIGVAMEATATITNGTAHIQTWSPLHTIGIPAWWGWEAEPTTTTQLGTGQ